MTGTRVLVWQWGRRGAGPRFAAALVDGLRQVPGVEAFLSLSSGAEILQGATAPHCDMPVETYATASGLAWRLAQSPLIIARLVRNLAALRPDVAICAMPGPLDLLLLAALHCIGAPAAVIVHDADPHPGDAVPFLFVLQRKLVRRADLVVALSNHVGRRLREQGLVEPERLLVDTHPPFLFGAVTAPPMAHGQSVRLLCFGRLLPYKGLDLLAAAIPLLGTQQGWELRVVGSGPESAELVALRALPGVVVENRWVPEEEIGELIAWADAVVLPYKEASQSGIAPAAIAAGRLVISTQVGGLVEQLRGETAAILCEPNPASLASVLNEVIARFPADKLRHTIDVRLAWRDLGERLLSRLAARRTEGM